MVLQIRAGEGVERAEGLIQQQRLGLTHEGARDAGPLRHAAGQGARQSAGMA